MNSLKISGLTFAYDQSASASWSIRDLSLEVSEREIVCILGASGCGKSTLLNLIAGLLKPTAGTIELSVENDCDRRIGYIFQEDALFPWRNVEQNLLLALELARYD